MDARLRMSTPAPPTETIASPTLEGVAIDRFRLVVTAGPDRGAEHLSDGGAVTIGGDPAAGFTLTCRAMSRFHCEIAPGPDGPVIRDLGSTNGTRVDGVRVQAAWLRRSATLELGRNQLRFELGHGPAIVEHLVGDRFGRLVGRSPAMRRAFARLARAAESDATVLLLGETGTGKDSAAEAIHAASARAAGPFVVVDCGALPGAMAQSELFGHLAGSFTGATGARVGALEAAHGGTLFIDEIGELPAALQPLLLRFLERREVKRLGADQSTRVDVRIIAATHRDLRREINAGRFRADLYHRLATLPIELPALRERREDLPLLVDALLEELLADPAVRAAARRRVDDVALGASDWPGNLRELRNHLERALVLDRGGGERPGEPPVRVGQPIAVAREEYVRWFERQYLIELLAGAGGNLREAARRAGVHRSHLHRLLVRAGLS